MQPDCDHHTHTVYSTHSHPEMTVANSLAMAARAGMKRLVVLEHVPEIGPNRRTFKSWYDGKNQRTQLDAIARDLQNLKPEVAHPGLKVLRGVEVDADPIALDGSAMLDDLSGIDVVIGSTHTFPGGAAFWFEQVELAPDQAMRVAFEWLAWAQRFVEAGTVQVLAHPGDLVGARQLVPPFDEKETLKFFTPLLESMAEHDVAFELNELLSSKFAPAYRHGYYALVALAKEIGLKFSLGSDAHRPEQVGVYEWVPKLMAAAGIGLDRLWVPGT